MEIVGRKRMRSEESPYILQSKIHVNEKIVVASDSNKLKQIHDKTINLLFNAARTQKISEEATDSNNSKALSLWQQVTLSGNGEINFRNFTDSVHGDFSLDRRKANCCDRETLIQEECLNCLNSPLCEYCGYSCSECGVFLCSSCVSLFGCGTTDRPICEKCSLYN